MVSAKKILLCLLLTSLSYTGCKNTDSDNNKHNQQTNTSNGKWYKRFTGTVNGLPVVVNIQCSGNTALGSYYYTDKGIIIDLVGMGHNNANTGDLTFSEDNPVERKPDDTSEKDNWQLSIQSNAATGKWVSGDAKISGDIDLKEDYPEGSYPLDIVVKGDSRQDRKGVVHVSAATVYELVQPAAQMVKEQADFLKLTIMHFLGGEYADAKNISDYVLQEDKKYFENFEKLLSDMKIDREAHEDWEYNFEHTRHLKVLYNNNGMLILQLMESEKTGGARMGSHVRSRYACIDMEQKKQWQLNDIIDEDAAKLIPLLDNEARTVFNILPSGTLTDKLRVDAIPLTDNFYITNTGITFCYYPGVLVPEEEGEIRLFLPYSKLKDLLKQDFKKRMPI